MVLVDHQEHRSTHAGDHGSLTDLWRGDQRRARRRREGHRRTRRTHVNTMVILVYHAVAHAAMIMAARQRSGEVEAAIGEITSTGNYFYTFHSITRTHPRG